MIEPKPLPYDYDALEPALGEPQVRIHYERHYLRYIRRTNELTRGRFASPEQAIQEAGRRRDAQLFDQAAQAWSHELYFASMRPGARGPSDRQLHALGPGFVERWVAAAKGVFGSGWVWLVPGRGVLRIVTTPNAELPGLPPLLVMDVWEHAYYCDYPGLREEYARAWIHELADWSRLRLPHRGRLYE